MLGDRDKNKSILLAVSALALETLIVLLHEFLTLLRIQPGPTSLSAEEFDMRFRHLRMTIGRQIRKFVAPAA
jgi:hypothetical protein